MTILTKLFLKKLNLEKIPLPLALGGELDDPKAPERKHGVVPEDQRSYSDYDEESMAFNNDKYSCYKSLIIFAVVAFLVTMGGFCGYLFYRTNVHSYQSMQYRGMCDIPYEQDPSTSARFYVSPDDAFVLDWRRFLYEEPHTSDDDELLLGNTDPEKYFREEITLNAVSDDEGFAKIEVPEFKDRRSGRFMHDFKENQSAIVDTASNRCFIMPLDRDTVLPPSSLQDLLQKMQSGYYNIDTERIRRNMRVITPQLADRSMISERIANECYDMNVYMIEDVEQSLVYKRSTNEARQEPSKYAEFIGRGIVEFNLLNMNDVNNYELAQKSN